MDVVDFASWYRREHPRLASTLVVVAGDVGTAAEAADEAFARAYERWDRVGVMDSPGGWAYRTALNVLHRRRRRARLEATLLRHHGDRRAGDLAGPPVDWSPEVWDALRRLPVRERIAMALRLDRPSSALDRRWRRREGDLGRGSVRGFQPPPEGGS